MKYEYKSELDKVITMPIRKFKNGTSAARE